MKNIKNEEIILEFEKNNLKNDLLEKSKNNNLNKKILLLEGQVLNLKNELILMKNENEILSNEIKNKIVNDNEIFDNKLLLENSKKDILDMILIIEKLKTENFEFQNENIELKKNKNSDDLIIKNLTFEIMQNENEIKNFQNILKVIQDKEINENIIKFHENEKNNNEKENILKIIHEKDQKYLFLHNSHLDIQKKVKVKNILMH